MVCLENGFDSIIPVLIIVQLFILKHLNLNLYYLEHMFCQVDYEESYI